MTLSTMIVDSELPARERLRSYLAEESAIQLVGICKAWTEAIHRIRTLEPDLLFLDVELPESDGFRLLEALDSHPAPAVIFTTRCSRHAYRAFEVSAVDYLIKPVERNRLSRALHRARRRLDQETAALGNGYAERLMVRTTGRVQFLRVEELDWIEADGNYVRLHSGGQTFRMRQTLTAVEAHLDPSRFVRLHRSVMVNRERIESLQILPRGDHTIQLTCGQELQTSRSCRGRVLEALRAFG